MEAPIAPHPNDRVLHAYGLGKLDDPAVAAAVDSHLEACEACQRRVAELSGDSFVGRLRDAGDGPRADSAPPSAAPGPPHSHVPKGPDPALAGTLPPELTENPQYEILRELGRGGMGVVYLARNTLMDRLEVLKVLNKEMLERKGTYDRFLREIRAAARLNHLHVVAAYSAVQMGRLLVFAMEYVDGADLSCLVKARGPLPLAHACSFIAQAALGLQHAHERGMVHRDIKPGNLILTRQGKRGIVKILDFGLAKATSENPIDAGLTREGQMLGTPDYVAPEQTLDAQKADIRADIYSLGCTLYYLLSGGPPFHATSLYEILQAHHSMEARPLNLVRPEVPWELAAVVGRMMAKEREQRYQTPAEVAGALKPFFTNKSAGPGGVKTEVSPSGEHAAVVEGAPAASSSAAPKAPAGNLSQPGVSWDSLLAIPAPEGLTAVKPKPAISGRPRPWPSWIRPALGAGAILVLVIACVAGLVRLWRAEEQRIATPVPPPPPWDGIAAPLTGKQRPEPTEEETKDANPAGGSPAATDTLAFDGGTQVRVAGSEAFDMTRRDYTIFARVKTQRGGTLFSRAARAGPWVPDGKTLFIRNGRLGFDIGWVGFVGAHRPINDDRWHEVAMTYTHEDGRVRLFVDGTPDGEGKLVPKRDAPAHVVRIGYTAPPDCPARYFDGAIAELRFYQRALTLSEIASLARKEPDDALAAARWRLDRSAGPTVPDETGHGHQGTIEVAEETTNPKRFDALLDKFVPGFTVKAAGVTDTAGLAIVNEHFGRRRVLRTHPVNRQTPCVLEATIDVPAGQKTTLALDVAHHPHGDWQLVVKANGQVLRDSVIGPATTRRGWAEIRVDLSHLAGQKVKLELLDQANNWAWEYGFWGRIEIVSERVAAGSTGGSATSAIDRRTQALVDKPPAPPAAPAQWIIRPGAPKSSAPNVNFPVSGSWPLLSPDDTNAWWLGDGGAMTFGARGLIITAGQGGNHLLTKKRDYLKSSLKLSVALSQGAELYLALHARPGTDGWHAITLRVAEDAGKVLAGGQSVDFKASEAAQARLEWKAEQFYNVTFEDDGRGACRVLVNGKPVLPLPRAPDAANAPGAVGLFVKSGSIVVRSIDIR
jgi:serine/threonine protein kinase